MSGRKRLCKRWFSWSCLYSSFLEVELISGAPWVGHFSVVLHTANSPRSEVKPQTPSFAHFALLDLSLLLVTLTFPLLRFCAILVMMPCQSDTQTRGPEDLFNLVRRQLYFFPQQSSAMLKTLSLKVDTIDPMYGTAQSVGNITAFSATFHAILLGAL